MSPTSGDPRSDDIDSLPAIVSRNSVLADATAGADAFPRKIPWHDPEFSERMLAEHLDQSHPGASRPFATIDAHVDWILDAVLRGRPGRVLDLGCGPGLYTERLARRGCSCVGVDFSPAAVEYAELTAERLGLDCTYHHADLTTAELGTGFDLAMLIFGELNTFSRDQAADLLRRTADALEPGAALILEPHSYEAVVRLGEAPSSWYSSTGGLFSPQAHLFLAEQAWDKRSGTSVFRFMVVDAETAKVDVYGQQLVAYTDDEFRRLLDGAGFSDIELQPGFGAATDPETMVITARRR